MTEQEGIQQAIDVIGKGEPNDYIISPTSHAELYKENAPMLSSILQTSNITITAQQYEEEDKKAITFQNDFRRIFDRSNVFTLTTSICITLVLVIGMIGPIIGEQLQRIMLVVMSLSGVMLGALASRYLSIIRQGNLLGRWMSKRAAAESFRLEYFEGVAKAAIDQPEQGDVPLNLLVLEYFRRYQLDVQRIYFKKRGDEHLRKSNQILTFGSWMVAMAAVITGLSGILGYLNIQFASLAALGSAFTAFSSFTTAKESVFQYRKNAERYEKTAIVLQNLYKRLDDVRKLVFQTDGTPLMQFIEAVNEQLSLEHRQWLDEQEKARGAFATLEVTLKKLSEENSVQGES